MRPVSPGPRGQTIGRSASVDGSVNPAQAVAPNATIKSRLFSRCVYRHTPREPSPGTASMCSASKPKVTPMPDPPPPQTVVTEDTAAIEARGRERRRAGAREGRRSTILAGAGGAPTTQSKTVLGA